MLQKSASRNVFSNGGATLPFHNYFMQGRRLESGWGRGWITIPSLDCTFLLIAQMLFPVSVCISFSFSFFFFCDIFTFQYLAIQCANKPPRGWGEGLPVWELVSLLQAVLVFQNKFQCICRLSKLFCPSLDFFRTR